MNKILIATASYNEVDNIGRFLAEVVDAVPDGDILVVDDNSPDGTGAVLESSKDLYPQLAYLSRPRKLGIGSAHLIIMQYALENEYDALITLDADLSHQPSDIPIIIQLLHNHEFVIGSRYVSGGSCDYGFLRQVLSRGANVLTRVLLGIKSKESTTSFRGFSRNLLTQLPLIPFKASDYGFFVETVFWINQISTKTAEFPIHFRDRQFGQTKISHAAIFQALLVLFKLWWLKRSGLAAKVLKKRSEELLTSPSQICEIDYSVSIRSN